MLLLEFASCLDQCRSEYPGVPLAHLGYWDLTVLLTHTCHLGLVRNGDVPVSGTLVTATPGAPKSQGHSSLALDDHYRCSSVPGSHLGSLFWSDIAAHRIICP